MAAAVAGEASDVEGPALGKITPRKRGHAVQIVKQLKVQLLIPQRMLPATPVRPGALRGALDGELRIRVLLADRAPVLQVLGLDHHAHKRPAVPRPVLRLAQTPHPAASAGG